MRVHHLDCCTMCPPARHRLNAAGHLVGHVLVVETDTQGLVLVDTGIGRDCVADLRRWLGTPMKALMRPIADVTRTAHHQIGALGLDPADVRHVVLTHLDADHAGGLADFPQAEVHVHGAELDAAINPTTTAEKHRYRRRLWDHQPRWRTFRPTGSDTWKGFAAGPVLAGGAHPIDGLKVLALPGHSRGHSLVAVDRGEEGWIVHAGDAYFQHATVHGPTSDAPRPRALMTAFEKVVALDRTLLAENHQRLRSLAAEHDVTVVCAHDPAEFASLATDD